MNDFARTELKVFDSPLYRLALLRLSESKSAFAVVIHHLVADGWGMMLIMGRVTERYNQIIAGAAPSDRTCAYRDCVAGDNAYLGAPAFAADEQYWASRLANPPPALIAPLEDAARYGRAQAYVREIDLPFSIHTAFERHGAAAGASALHAILACVYGYFGRLRRADDVVLGVAVLNRRTPRERATIAMAATVVPLRLTGGFRRSITECQREVAALLRHGYRRHRYPLSALNHALGLFRTGRERPFDIAVSYLASPNESMVLGGAPVDAAIQLLSGHELKPLQIYVNAMDSARPFRLSLVYNSRYFNAESIDSVSEGLAQFVRFTADNPDAHLLQVPLMIESERRKVLWDLNNTAIPFPDDRCLHEIFARVAAERPAAIALQMQGSTLGYAALDARANQVAHVLRRLGVGPDIVVGLLAERSFDMVTAIFGILKAGGAYLPLDPGFPVERLSHIVRDADARIVVIDPKCIDHAPSFPQHVRVVRLSDPEINSMPTAAPRTAVSPRNLAYVIYTSGSTGSPKGVLVPHLGLCNLVAAHARLFSIQTSDCVLQFARLSFDASIWEIVMALGAGATLCLARADELAPGPDLARTLRENRIGIATLPPAVLPFLASYEFPSLRSLIVAGEACQPTVAVDWAAKYRFFNAYGPTEGTVCASVARFNAGGRVPIGNPIGNTQLYILDEQLAPVPTGVTGELYIAGVGLARGYLGRAALTAERFVANPFDPGQRMYRTGDLARRLPTGELDFVGRTDRQVKVRGFRVELGEVERALLDHAAVRQAIVVAEPSAEAGVRLLAYVALREDFSGEATRTRQTAGPQVVTAHFLREYLRGVLPEFMTPDSVTIVDAIALNANGKVDKSALPPPRAQTPFADLPRVPRSTLESLVTGIWEEVLEIRNPALDVNFFEIGGNSLALARVLQLLNANLSLDLSFTELLRHPTIDSLVRRLQLLTDSSTSRTSPEASDAAQPSGLRTLFARKFRRKRDPQKNEGKP